ncbi:translation initiation factor eIF-2B [Halalkalicoccus sp. NIPERK01]|uniref:translation initiation factor eIF-2B n=1 Tax=Halalkalicoccus sp. NIPERK01 TaxID=3053469 RepID=UPI00256F053C|nr:translation initiation factor eIF-2B [Halalkalicoccus sp. NIPERK01]MDL5361390.1 translation initiation factor eIF-2B [Halalkalicoccus sp. NIPERK01]
MIDETVEEIEEMQTHSSSIVAVKAARALSELTGREYATVEEFVRDVERNSSVLRRANPSHASLYNVQRTITREVEEADPQTVEEGKAALTAAIEKVVDRIEDGKARAAAHTADYLEDGMTLLTHDYSSTVNAAIERAVGGGVSLSVYVTEARPRLAGRKTARRLAGMDGVEPTLIVDSAAGTYLDECDCVLMGMDCLVSDTLYNRIGTYPIAATAADLDVPMYVTGSGAKLIDGGFVFENEYRPASEVMLEPVEGFAIENPLYDATPVRLLDAIITDDGAMSL